MGFKCRDEVFEEGDAVFEVCDGDEFVVGVCLIDGARTGTDGWDASGGEMGSI